MSEELQQSVGEVCIDYKRLSKSALDACLDRLLAEPAGTQQADELQRLLHELQVHQIELEIQNRELRESQQELEEARDRYADLYDFAPVGYLTLDDKGKILAINLRGAAMLGRERSRLIGMPLVPLLVPGESRILFEHLTQVFRSSDRVVHELRSNAADGTPMVVRIESVAVNRNETGVNTCRTALIDISPQRRIEDALREGEKRFRAIFEQAAVGVAVINSRHGKFQRINQKYSDIIGYSSQEMDTLDLRQITHPDDLQPDLVNMKKLLAGEIREFSMEKRLFRKGGSTVWVNLTVSPMWSVGETPSFYIAIIEDITQRKHIEAVLEGRRQVLEHMVTGASLDEVLNQLVATTEALNPLIRCAVLLLDEERQRLHLGAAPSLPVEYQRLIDGVEVDKGVVACGKAVRSGKLVIVEDIMMHSECVACREAAKKAGLHACWGVPIISSVGEVLGLFTFYFQEVGAPVPEDLEFAQGSAQLASIAIERHRSEERERQHQAEQAHLARLNMMGEMATGMAHELNQPLSAISTYTSVGLKIFRAGTKQPDMLEEALEGAREQAERASGIIRHLRQLVRKQPPLKEDVDLNALVKDVQEFMQFEIRKHRITLSLELDECMPKVIVDSIQLEQVFMNLLRNSIEAMQADSSEGREVIVRTSLNSDGMVQVTMVDSGPGMSAEILNHIFEPFVTTKGALGMGMGLSICRSIIEAHGGRLWAESQLGRGATFFLTLPLSKQVEEG